MLGCEAGRACSRSLQSFISAEGKEDGADGGVQMETIICFCYQEEESIWIFPDLFLDFFFIFGVRAHAFTDHLNTYSEWSPTESSGVLHRWTKNPLNPEVHVRPKEELNCDTVWKVLSIHVHAPPCSAASLHPPRAAAAAIFRNNVAVKESVRVNLKPWVHGNPCCARGIRFFWLISVCAFSSWAEVFRVSSPDPRWRCPCRLRSASRQTDGLQTFAACHPSRLVAAVVALLSGPEAPFVSAHKSSSLPAGLRALGRAREPRGGRAEGQTDGLAAHSFLHSDPASHSCGLLWESNTRPAACSSGEKWRSLRAPRWVWTPLIPPKARKDRRSCIYCMSSCHFCTHVMLFLQQDCSAPVPEPPVSHAKVLRCPRCCSTMRDLSAADFPQKVFKRGFRERSASFLAFLDPHSTFGSIIDDITLTTWWENCDALDLMIRKKVRHEVTPCIIDVPSKQALNSLSTCAFLLAEGLGVDASG